MDRLPVSTVPQSSEWTCEIKLDGYRLEAAELQIRFYAFDALVQNSG
jgi:ATP-dependent DNA ligase